MSDPVVRFVGVTKRYRRGLGRSFLLRTLLGSREKSEVITPLDDLSFDLAAGEALGLVGRNGTGKSTLLKTIVGGCIPTTGEVIVRGRVAPVLSISEAFSGDLTGRDVLELDARILGYTPSELLAQHAAIVAFAELESALDTPMRRFSSGMQMRLGISVALHAQPDLVLIDEQLAHADLAFQTKCIARLEQLRDRGTTIAMVSHSLDHVRRLCTRAIWLRDGKIAMDGPPDSVCDAYQAYAEI